MILAKLLDGLFSNGVIILTTSKRQNRPSSIKTDCSVNASYLPIDLIENKLKVIELAGTYRLSAARSRAGESLLFAAQRSCYAGTQSAIFVDSG